MHLLKISDILLESYRELMVKTERQASQMQRYGIEEDDQVQFFEGEVLEETRQSKSAIKSQLSCSSTFES
jgi:hypothetical protein